MIREFEELAKRERSGKESSDEIEMVSDTVRGLGLGRCDSLGSGGEKGVASFGGPRLRRLRGGPSSLLAS
ncbi:hypothetical protein AGABI1DRAFT_112707 [Agaricus bisporus var. burnettii JB137-S8]|uniref:Uncharacterized protein n=1 Tax=Agaricus bisporus var. burnettii (strain JB137-S8 / ATCC MYA-4627 / FGSC 10392) TaxID=597362 RepID=K5W2H8_AGABU|nr:hypothetical protein AGABI2DRAFT_192671 [Agaricus bisporus var. bisporus H97]XP_007328538.1 uncharacterized protein AGABI1DRAFT_112707 [Agaricus bisporus var. burnettii JB137-S8]EKM81004.1 hypothetical protein AGABI1DRAFT_112707 [Agaricus bisporus var. burnettii JB137-S8]EKV47485.1 hypothetical protein AGABI2DRAFT_192671 [Agaricus bisporus var. bisporus H97]